MTSRAMSARSRASRARRTEKYSVPRSVRDLRRMPAVSTKHTVPSGVSTTVSTASRVVPGASWVTDRSSPTSRLNRVDLPTLGRPTSATRGMPAPAVLARRPDRRPVGRHRRPARPRLGEEADHIVEEVPGPPAVEGADRPGLSQPEGHGVPGVGLPLGRVHLVDHHPHRPARPLEHPGHGQVLVDEADGDVHHQQDHVGLGDGPLGLGADLGVERVVGGQPAAGVDHGEGPPAPLGVELLAVAGDPGSLLDHGGPPAHDAVDQRGLADVGPSGDDHQRAVAPFGQRLGQARGHRDAPRVTGTRSASGSNRPPLEGPAQGEAVGGHHLDGAGQSATVRSSRNRPSDRHESGRR